MFIRSTGFTIAFVNDSAINEWCNFGFFLRRFPFNYGNKLIIFFSLTAEPFNEECKRVYADFLNVGDRIACALLPGDNSCYSSLAYSFYLIGEY